MTHLHIGGDWNDFLKQHNLPSSHDELDQATTKQIFADSFLDTLGLKLYRARVWLRKREDLDGFVEWSLKRRFVLDGNKIEYEETKGVENILAILRRDFDLELFDAIDLEIGLPKTVAWLRTVRVNIIQQPEVYFDLVLFSSKCYATFTTHTSPAPRSTTKPRTRLLSKVFVWSYFNDKEYFNLLRDVHPV